ncbi:hepatoma-derived growth factor-like [Condylostylus longicornis]|uniref:hepatoma-derived growth factor-like n=1 Tax=Condylostylus longicornis TaxID=2530218 RepID=UPI00244DA947|nr:hepatoma-derived growth factor-like [Condylostylus longicornis]
MGKKDKTFQVDDLVFAKVKGYPAWPAKVMKLLPSKKFNVYFYGTGETANIKIEDIFHYTESKEKFATDKNLKRANFREAIEQIEAALNGEDSAPIKVDNLESGSPTGNKEDITKQKENVNDNKDHIEQLKMETSVVVNKLDDIDSSMSVMSPNTIKDKEGHEITSRSGRKIKPKRYIDDDNEQPQSKHRKIATPTQEHVLESKMEMAQKSALTNTRNLIPTDPIILAEKRKLVEEEMDLQKTICDIKCSLGLHFNDTDLDKCIELLTNLQKSFKFTPIMLKKVPEIVEVIKKMRRYVGNDHEWKLTGEVKENFEKKAQIIRDLCKNIYDSFRPLFPDCKEDKQFFEYFNEQVEKFKELTKSYSKEELMFLFDDITESATPTDEKIKVMPDLEIKDKVEESETLT